MQNNKPYSQDEKKRNWRRSQLFKKLAGFTLIEVMVALGIMAILAGMAAPSFISTIERYKVRTLREDMISSIYLTRTEAMRRGGNVSLSKKTGDATSCAGLAINGRWECGWDIKHQNITTIQQHEASRNLKLTVNGTTPNNIAFDRWGQATGCFSFEIQSNTTADAKQQFHLTGAGTVGEGACTP